MSKKPSLSYYIIPTVILSTLLTIGIVWAWTEPSGTPPGGNVAAPINVSAGTQTFAGSKTFNFSSGGLLINSWLNVNGALSAVRGYFKSTGSQIYIQETDAPDPNDMWLLESNGGIFNLYHRNEPGPVWTRVLSALTNGNVGIGMGNPTQKLDVAGQIHATEDICTDAGGGVCLSAASGGEPGPTLPSGSSGQTLRHNGTDWVANNTIFNDGSRVGIRTTSPGANLDVNGSVRSNNSITSLRADTTGQPLFFNAQNSAGEALQLKYTEEASGSIPADAWQFRAGGTARDVIFSRYDTPILTMKASNSSVGIGTVNPAYKLDVSGDVRGTRLCIGSDCRDAWPSGGTGGITHAPSDGKLYGSKYGTWTPVPVQADAPSDNKVYGRKNGSWVEVSTGTPAPAPSGNCPAQTVHFETGIPNPFIVNGLYRSNCWWYPQNYGNVKFEETLNPQLEGTTINIWGYNTCNLNMTLYPHDGCGVGMISCPDGLGVPWVHCEVLGTFRCTGGSW